MTVFRILSAVSILAALAAIGFHVGSSRQTGEFRAFAGRCATLFGGLWRPVKRTGAIGGLRRARHLLYGTTLVLFVILAVTGFLQVLLLGEHLSGVLLVVHVTAAPLFALAVAGIAVLWSEKHVFGAEDWYIVTEVFRTRRIGVREVLPLVLKKLYWAILFLFVPLVGTVILEVFPIFGTEGEEFLISLHGYTGLLLLLIALAHSYLVVLHAGPAAPRSPAPAEPAGKDRQRRRKR
jgi:cytochrome b561